MKTLTQLLEKKGFSKTFTTEDLETFDEIKLIKEAFKEWLQQKQQELRCRYSEKFIANAFINYIENEFLEEL